MRINLQITAMAGLVLLAATAASAAEPKLQPLRVQDKTVVSECGDCHMVFSPSKLSTKGWEKLMANLSDLLRITLTSQDAEHTLRQEMDLIDLYLKIMKARFG